MIVEVPDILNYRFGARPPHPDPLPPKGERECFLALLAFARMTALQVPYRIADLASFNAASAL